MGNGALDFDATSQIVRWNPYAWGGLISVFVLIYLTALAGTWLATAVARWPLRRYHEAAWTERARRAWPSRRLGPAASGILAGLSAVGSEHSPGLYAQSLEKIHEANLVPAVLRSQRMTHPDLYDRMVQSGVTPSYPRPAAPPRWPGLLGLATLIVAAVLGIIACEYVTGTLPRAWLDPASVTIWRIGAGRE